MRQQDKWFYRGCAVAIAVLINEHGFGTEAKDVWRNTIRSWETLLQADPQEWELNILEKHFKTNAKEGV